MAKTPLDQFVEELLQEASIGRNTSQYLQAGAPTHTPSDEKDVLAKGSDSDTCYISPVTSRQKVSLQASLPTVTLVSVASSSGAYNNAPTLYFFLPRPLGQEDAASPWAVWEPLLSWLQAYHPDALRAVFDAEGAILILEQSGVTAGAEYEAACAKLVTTFERARRLKLSTGAKVWLQ